ncbi:CoA transferase [Myxococcota bacterium]|nr:CoA transferase [Myxococcota bacterium]
MSDASKDLPLTDLKVVDFSRLLPGPWATQTLADMGADVIRIEPPGGDPTRALAPFFQGQPGPDRSLFFLYMNTSKRGITLDYTQPAGRALMLNLVRQADLVVESCPPGFLARYGLGYTDLAAERSTIVQTSITGFGQTRPHRDWSSTDLVAGAMGGSLYVTGEAEDPPVSLAGHQNHLMDNTAAAASSLIALRHAGKTGQGQHVDISIQETTLAISHISGVGKWLDDGIIPRRVGSGLTASVPSGAYLCRDGRVYLMVNRPAHWAALAQWIHEETGNQEVLDPLFEGPSSRRIEYRELLDLFIGELTEQHTVQDIFQEGQRRHIAFTPLYSPAEVVRDAHLAARDFFVSVPHPSAESIRMPGAPYHHAATPWAIRRPAPRFGEHNESIYCGELGIQQHALQELIDLGVV